MRRWSIFDDAQYNDVQEQIGENGPDLHISVHLDISVVSGPDTAHDKQQGINALHYCPLPPDSRHASLSRAVHLLTKFHLQKCRMYDLMSVFAVIGCCEKISVDSGRCIGPSMIPFAIRK
jgi:hypothetical protein